MLLLQKNHRRPFDGLQRLQFFRVETGGLRTSGRAQDQGQDVPAN
jgi:hypothetical protein